MQTRNGTIGHRVGHHSLTWCGEEKTGEFHLERSARPSSRLEPYADTSTPVIVEEVNISDFPSVCKDVCVMQQMFVRIQL